MVNGPKRPCLKQGCHVLIDYPSTYCDDERKSHRTKAELEVRKKAEEALLSRIKFKEKKEVKDNPVAHKEFLRIKKLFIAIEKNDGLYENAVNRYCQLFAECNDFEKRREFFFEDIKTLRKEFEDKNIDFLTYEINAQGYTDTLYDTSFLPSFGFQADIFYALFICR